MKVEGEGTSPITSLVQTDVTQDGRALQRGGAREMTQPPVTTNGADDSKHRPLALPDADAALAEAALAEATEPAPNGTAPGVEGGPPWTPPPPTPAHPPAEPPGVTLASNAALVAEELARRQGAGFIATNPSQGGWSETLWRTAQEVATATPVAVDWVLPPWVARGSITELTAKVKAGKTTLAMHAIHAVLGGHDFLGWRARRGPGRPAHRGARRDPAGGADPRRVARRC